MRERGHAVCVCCVRKREREREREAVRPRTVPMRSGTVCSIIDLIASTLVGRTRKRTYIHIHIHIH